VERCRGGRSACSVCDLEPTAANRHPAVALYERGPEVETGLSIQVLTFSGGVVTSITGFVGDELFPAFGLPTTWSR